ncbi:type II toxin-antitoxin system VapC family toxin [Phycisphaera mikurensis]|uniref:PIN domain-containing protein n=1 Tax=Phycisphaera mikurensis (strain NBRC 102666 / KCTC 22515 / FYK2301M01) TaxID=1142394 RepID=I0IHL0_PHYMF|nr:type II toxin-antitoxin system VapC family toxin [Phycisphaera mikurensis]MBB6440993.1 PIN domain nuclease of toxin-antitoxin system [Phycisphaera mikurensis]BAM04748.1 hypothetical protein PSMK_25890 [Phycisphaera mikurensis NBRC 102666]
MSFGLHPEGYLLDTHVLLRWQFESARLPERVRELLRREDPRIIVSVCSLWEIRIKERLGKLKLPARFIDVLRSDAIQRLNISTEHALTAGAFDPLHGDPFDRMLVAQAQLENLTLVAADGKLAAYGVPILDAKPKRR